MKIEIESQRENPLLNRKEVIFRVLHEGGGTPKRSEVLSLLKEALNLKKEAVVLRQLKSEYGRDSSVGEVRVYPTLEDAKKVEPDHLLKRSGLIEEKKE
ncbi:MAG: 30S ribosomal protein S24e [Thermoplasmata archaeon]|nr:30S ribosomal protein S24e [Thermoplasmata archaeon]OYT47916.1 MAG: 30S ribosomal protein S24e [Thermoplasmatales archaeon ex4484_36]HDD60632.1 30S ribosomal protein S24e [Euryarchaeota archaeon]RLF55577.1 MAG: 30S ribosomal protein S24e [Thermoplasmata archaeon]RLF69808.1 MAG: 30S ribosomal protein S24e [Thermoplasmata archaeon]